MAVAFAKIVAGMILYDRHRHKMGNTTITALGEWNVEVLAVDEVKRGAMCRWNGNEAEWWPERRLRQLYTWSMYDEDVKVTRNILGGVSSVRRKRAKVTP